MTPNPDSNPIIQDDLNLQHIKDVVSDAVRQGNIITIITEKGNPTREQLASMVEPTSVLIALECGLSMEDAMKYAHVPTSMMWDWVSGWLTLYLK